MLTAQLRGYTCTGCRQKKVCGLETKKKFVFRYSSETSTAKSEYTLQFAAKLSGPTDVLFLDTSFGLQRAHLFEDIPY